MPGLPERFASLFELITTLDRRLLQALDSVADMAERIAGAEERIDKEMALFRVEAKERLDELGPRLERLEQALFNIERATTRLDQTVEGAIEALPDTITKRIKVKGKRAAPSPFSGPAGSDI